MKTVGAGFGFLAFWWLFIIAYATVPKIILSTYYVFFCLFMLGLGFRVKSLHTYCGFVNDPVMKSLFYLVLATFSLPDFRVVVNDIIGGCFLFFAVVNLGTMCWKKPDAATAKNIDK